MTTKEKMTEEAVTSNEQLIEEQTSQETKSEPTLEESSSVTGVEEASTPKTNSKPKKRFKLRRLSERLCLTGIGLSLVGLTCFYGNIARLAMTYDEQIINDEVTMDGFSTEQESSSTESMESDQLSSSESYSPLTAIVTTEYLNVRKEANTTSEKLGVLYEGQSVAILENDESSDFIKISFEASEGYVHRDFLRFE